VRFQPVVIYTKASCPYCMKAKYLLLQKKIPFEEIDIAYHPEKRAEMVQRSQGRHTVPQIFIGKYHVGGYEDFMHLEQDGCIDPLLAANYELLRQAPCLLDLDAA